MVLPLIIGGVVLASSALGLGTYFGLSNQAPDTTNANNYTTQYTTQIKNNEIIIGSNSKIGELTIKDKMLSKQNATQTAKATSSSGLDTNLLLIGGATAGVVYLMRSKK